MASLQVLHPDDIAEEVSRKHKKLSFTPFVVAIGILAILYFSRGIPLQYLDLKPINVIPGVVALAGTIFAVFTVSTIDKLRKTTVLYYQVDSELESKYERVIRALGRLSQCDRIKVVRAEAAVLDRKYHAGASEVVDSKGIRVKHASPKYIRTNIDVWTIPAGDVEMVFFPDRLLLVGKDAAAIAYQKLAVTVAPYQLIETSAPSDGRVVGQTWRYTNKKGGPDRRFAHNPEMPIVEYEEVSFSARGGFREVLLCSRAGLGEELRQAITQLTDWAVALEVEKKNAERLKTAKPQLVEKEASTVWVCRGEERYGPYTPEQIRDYLKEGFVLATDLAWIEAEKSWVPVGQALTRLQMNAS